MPSALGREGNPAESSSLRATSAGRAADAGGRECRRQILGDAEDCSADIGGSNGVCAKEFGDELLCCQPDFLFFVAPDGDGAAYAAHSYTPL